jgi:nucleotide-binding universal stress UspA family protein
MKLLAALDLSPSAPAVLREARVWARRLSAELILIHVADPDPDFVGRGAGLESLRLAVAHKFQRAQKQLEALAIELRQDGVDATALLLQEGDTADTILREAERLHADAILMGTHARGAAHAMFIGSVSKQVLLHATRPVVLIPPHDTP